MKIVKEVIIKAAIADTWSWLTDDRALTSLLNSSNDDESRRSGNPLRLSGLNTIGVEPMKKILLGGKTELSISTILELSEQGKRTGLKVTVKGWETVDPETARTEMPRVSLTWEKKLGILKKAIEVASQKHSKSL